MEKSLLKNKTDWVTIEINHERYSFETNLGLWKNMTLDEVIRQFYSYKVEDIEVMSGNRYIIDNSHHSELDTQYSYPNIDSSCIQHIHLDTLLIVELKTFIEEECASFVWGQTENKFGLLDIKRKGE